MERTFIMIKPEHIHMAELVLKELDHYGERTLTRKVESVPSEVIEAHYSDMKGKPHYSRVISSFIGKPVVLALYEGSGVVKKMVDIIGPTDPSVAPAHTIRARYSSDSMAKATAEGRSTANVVHRSASAEDVERELEAWSMYLK